MGLRTDGRAPGPVRFHLACDAEGCNERTSFDLVIEEPPPGREDGLLTHLLHEATCAAPFIRGLGWALVAEGEGYRCRACRASSQGRAVGRG